MGSYHSYDIKYGCPLQTISSSWKNSTSLNCGNIFKNWIKTRHCHSLPKIIILDDDSDEENIPLTFDLGNWPTYQKSLLNITFGIPHIILFYLIPNTAYFENFLRIPKFDWIFWRASWKWHHRTESPPSFTFFGHQNSLPKFIHINIRNGYL